jgi:hypothetical protein
MRERSIKPGLAHAVTAVALAVCAAEPAYAYLDPGTGNIILQAVLATVAGALVSLKLYGQKILIFFRRMFPRSPESAPASESESRPPNEKAS